MRSLQVRWVSFHSYFDFGYLVKVRMKFVLPVCIIMWPFTQVLSNSRLPDKECDFFTALTDFFPCFFDIKASFHFALELCDLCVIFQCLQYMMKSCESLKGGLSKIAQTLEVIACCFNYGR